MKTQSKNLYEKMVDFKRFAIVLLAVGVFFYLGVIIPSGSKDPMDVNIMMLVSASFLAVSILFFSKSKLCKIKLLEMEDNHEHFSN
ncbi:YrhC family protein [Neobacillus niacini]|uniref:YrhC family protein n=1 Tax=Neobacillus niacini TaxID=86668 RepID=UPI0028553259|nr:YrhC family protein [Neobacillus niacini]MDR7000371.1 membrane glycosyltransferase [Neobacillus niacini]